MPRKKVNTLHTPLPGTAPDSGMQGATTQPVPKNFGNKKKPVGGYKTKTFTAGTGGTPATPKLTLHGMIGTAIAGHWANYSEHVGDGERLLKCLATVQHDRVRINSVVAGLTSLEEQISTELHRLNVTIPGETAYPGRAVGARG